MSQNHFCLSLSQSKKASVWPLHIFLASIIFLSKAMKEHIECNTLRFLAYSKILGQPGKCAADKQLLFCCAIVTGERGLWQCDQWRRNTDESMWMWLILTRVLSRMNMSSMVTAFQQSGSSTLSWTRLPTPNSWSSGVKVVRLFFLCLWRRGTKHRDPVNLQMGPIS
jgi:hypothetical protein